MKIQRVPQTATPTQRLQLERAREPYDRICTEIRFDDYLDRRELNANSYDWLRVIGETTATGAVPVGLVQAVLWLHSKGDEAIKERADQVLGSWTRRGALDIQSEKGRTFSRSGEQVVIDSREPLGKDAWSKDFQRVAYNARDLEGFCETLADHPKEAAAHFDEIAELTATAADEWTLTFSPTRLLGSLTKAAPGKVDRPFLEKQIPLMMESPESHRVPELLQSWWKTDAELVAPSLELVVEQLGKEGGDKFANLFYQAITRYDYRPSPRAMTWLAQRSLAIMPVTPSPDWEPRHLLGSLVEVKRRYPELIESMAIGPNQEPLEDVLYRKYLDRTSNYQGDMLFRELSNPYPSPFIKRFCEFVELETRREDLLDRCRATLSQTVDPDQAPGEAFVALGLVARLAHQEPELKEELLPLVGLLEFGSRQFTSLQDYTLRLFQGKLIETELESLHEVPIERMSNRLDFLLTTCRELKLPERTEQTLSVWEGLARQEGLGYICDAFEDPEEAYQAFASLSRDPSQRSWADRWQRFERVRGLNPERSVELYDLVASHSPDEEAWNSLAPALAASDHEEMTAPLFELHRDLVTSRPEETSQLWQQFLNLWDGQPQSFDSTLENFNSLHQMANSSDEGTFELEDDAVFFNGEMLSIRQD